MSYALINILFLMILQFFMFIFRKLFFEASGGLYFPKYMLHNIFLYTTHSNTLDGTYGATIFKGLIFDGHQWCHLQDKRGRCTHVALCCTLIWQFWSFYG